MAGPRAPSRRRRPAQSLPRCAARACARGVAREGSSEVVFSCFALQQLILNNGGADHGGRLLYWLLYQRLFTHFPHQLSPFRIFRYVTFRTAFASLTALFMGLIIGPAIIRQLREFQIGQYIREEGPSGHHKKAGTPTMGGVLIVIAIVVPTLLWADLSNPYIWLCIFATVAFGAIGFADDYIKVVQRRNLGLQGRTKLLLQFLAAG